MQQISSLKKKTIILTNHKKRSRLVFQHLFQHSFLATKLMALRKDRTRIATGIDREFIKRSRNVADISRGRRGRVKNVSVGRNLLNYPVACEEWGQVHNHAA